MSIIKIINESALKLLEKGQDAKVLLNQHKIYFGYLNIQHQDIEKSYFGYDEKLEKTIPGYIKPHSKTIELRKSKIPEDILEKTLNQMQSLDFLKVLDGYKIVYHGKNIRFFNT